MTQIPPSVLRRGRISSRSSARHHSYLLVGRGSPNSQCAKRSVAEARLKALMRHCCIHTSYKHFTYIIAIFCNPGQAGPRCFLGYSFPPTFGQHTSAAIRICHFTVQHSGFHVNCCMPTPIRIEMDVTCGDELQVGSPHVKSYCQYCPAAGGTQREINHNNTRE